MQKAKSHYDNLKVSRDAPQEVVRAAYRSLAQKYHPDRNQNSPEAVRIMGLINKAYEVLSDPAKRSDHDAWLQSVERNASTQKTWSFTYDVPGGATAKVKPSVKPKPRERVHESKIQEPVSNATPTTFGLKVAQHVRANWFFYVFAGMFVIFVISKVFTPTSSPASPSFGGEYAKTAAPWAGDEVVVPPQNTTKHVAKDVGSFGKSSGFPLGAASNQTQRYVRPKNAPNGYPFPVSSGYIKGYRILNSDGHSSVTIDNSRNTSDVFVRLASLLTPEHSPVRQFFILAGQSFTLEKVRAGEYEIRYRDLDTGAIARSEAIQLRETIIDNGIKFSRVSITLYKVRDGNMKTYPIDEDAF